MKRLRSPHLFALLAASCGGDGASPADPGTGNGQPAAVASIVVEGASPNLVLSDSVRFSATLRDSQGRTLTGRLVVWSSGAPDVATVTQDGLVVGVSVGTAEITATSEGISGSRSVTVDLPEQLAYVVNRVDGDVSLIDLGTNRAVGARIPVGDQPHGMAATPDGSRVYVAVSGLHEVRGIDVATSTVMEPPIPVGRHPLHVAITPDGGRAYVTNHLDATVSVIDITTNAVVGTIPAGQNPIGIVTTPDGTRAFVASWGTGRVLEIDLAADTLIGSGIGPLGNPRGLALSPDGSTLFVSTGRGNVVAVDVVTGEILAPMIEVFDGQPGLLELAVTPDGGQAWVLHAAEGAVSVIDLASHAVFDPPMRFGNGPTSIAITDDGSRAYVTDISRNVFVIDISSREVAGSVIPVGNTPETVVIIR